jgi:hypothetical protein
MDLGISQGKAATADKQQSYTTHIPTGNGGSMDLGISQGKDSADNDAAQVHCRDDPPGVFRVGCPDV